MSDIQNMGQMPENMGQMPEKRLPARAGFSKHLFSNLDVNALLDVDISQEIRAMNSEEA